MNHFRGKNFTERDAERLIDYLKKLAHALGHTPTCKEVNERGEYNYHQYMSCFGSIRQAHILAGLTPNGPTISSNHKMLTFNLITKRMCVEDIDRIESMLVCYPSYDQLKAYAKYPFSVYVKYLGGMKWVRALTERKQVS